MFSWLSVIEKSNAACEAPCVGSSSNPAWLNRLFSAMAARRPARRADVVQDVIPKRRMRPRARLLHKAVSSVAPAAGAQAAGGAVHIFFFSCCTGADKLYQLLQQSEPLVCN